jgi:hypothetical protein
MLINTSLNVNEQPKVNPPLEVWHTYLCSGLVDVLHLGPCRPARPSRTYGPVLKRFRAKWHPLRSKGAGLKGQRLRLKALCLRFQTFAVEIERGVSHIANIALPCHGSEVRWQAIRW